MKMLQVVAATALVGIANAAMGACPPMSVYSLDGMEADNLPLSQAVDGLLTGTAWKATVSPDADLLRVTFRDVAGPLDKVLDMVVRQAQKASGVGVTMRKNAAECSVSIDRAPVPVAPASAVPAAASSVASHPAAVAQALAPPQLPRKVETLAAGKWLDAALKDYLRENGWQLRWNIEEHYMVDVALPLPGDDIVNNINWLVETYQLQNGMRGVKPRFTSNNVVVIEKTTATEARN